MSETAKSLKFYTDTHIAKAVAVQLRNRGIDIIRCEEVDMADAKDIEHLEYATQEGRIIITNDEDFLALDAVWREQGKTHAGIMHCRAQGEIAIGIIVKKCIALHENIESGKGILESDIVNQVIFVR
jgi:predicted nuclease of predicted toxin-antitoxin system